MKKLVRQQTALVPYQPAIIRVTQAEEPDLPIWGFFYTNLANDWEAAHPDWFKYDDDDDDDPYKHLRTDEAYAQRRRMWEAEARRLEAECWRRLGPGPKGWRIAGGRYEIGNLEPGIQVLRPERKKLGKSQKRLEAR
jgi:hypothetical protein